jgi:hypothetical protein
MKGTHFDTVAKVFATRRLSRRQAMRQGGAVAGAGALAAAGIAKSASAQEATPEAEGEKVEFLFLQSFQKGSIQKAGEDGTYTLTLEQGLGQTIYFSDRPERMVGAAPTADFLKGLGFPKDNPPNAALVMAVAPGDTDIAVLELFNPQYEESTHTATYDVKLLDNYDKTLEMQFTEEPKSLDQLKHQFGAANLFIDDCSDRVVTCKPYVARDTCPGGLGGNVCGRIGPVGYCWSWTTRSCMPCEPGWHTNPTYERVYQHWEVKCSTTIEACLNLRGGCVPEF